MNALLSIRQLIYHNIGPVDIELETGDCIGLSGPSGSGKTLFLRAVADLDPVQGRFFLDGVDRNAIYPPQWRSSVALLPAEIQWWFDKVYDHFVSDHIEGLQILDFEPDVLHWDVSRLSSGERQRLGLLRLLTMEPKVLLLDEPTANLDAVNIERVESLLLKYIHDRNAAAIWVGHDLEQLQRMTKLQMKIDGGRFITNNV